MRAHAHWLRCALAVALLLVAGPGLGDEVEGPVSEPTEPPAAAPAPPPESAAIELPALPGVPTVPVLPAARPAPPPPEPAAPEQPAEPVPAAEPPPRPAPTAPAPPAAAARPTELDRVVDELARRQEGATPSASTGPGSELLRRLEREASLAASELRAEVALARRRQAALRREGQQLAADELIWPRDILSGRVDAGAVAERVKQASLSRQAADDEALAATARQEELAAELARYRQTLSTAQALGGTPATTLRALAERIELASELAATLGDSAGRATRNAELASQLIQAVHRAETAARARGLRMREEAGLGLATLRRAVADLVAWPGQLPRLFAAELPPGPDGRDRAALGRYLWPLLLGWLLLVGMLQLLGRLLARRPPPEAVAVERWLVTASHVGLWLLGLLVFDQISRWAAPAAGLLDRPIWLSWTGRVCRLAWSLLVFDRAWLRLLEPRRAERRLVRGDDATAGHLRRGVGWLLAVSLVGLPVIFAQHEFGYEAADVIALTEAGLGLAWLALLARLLLGRGGPLALLARPEQRLDRWLQHWRGVLYSGALALAVGLLLAHLAGYRNAAREIAVNLPATVVLVALLTDFGLVFAPLVEAGWRKLAATVEAGSAAAGMLARCQAAVRPIWTGLVTLILAALLARLWGIHPWQLQPLVGLLDRPLLAATPQVTARTVAKGLLTGYVGLVLARLVRGRLSGTRLLADRMDTGAHYAATAISYYAMVIAAVVGGILVAGFNLGVLTVFAGMFGVAVGFGSQQIASNLISGVILLLDSAVNVGDFVDLAGTRGTIESITIRCSTIRTEDNRLVIVPNSTLLTSQIVGASTKDARVRLLIPVAVKATYAKDEVSRLLIDTALAQPGVLADPAPEVWVATLTAAKLDLQLAVWTDEYREPTRQQGRLTTAVYEALRAASIELA